MFGAWLRAQREPRGWSQRELARRAGLTSAAINQLESGKRRHPNKDSSERLAAVFGMTADDMLAAAYGQDRTAWPAALREPGSAYTPGTARAELHNRLSANFMARMDRLPAPLRRMLEAQLAMFEAMADELDQDRPARPPQLDEQDSKGDKREDKDE